MDQQIYCIEEIEASADEYCKHCMGLCEVCVLQDFICKFPSIAMELEKDGKHEP